MLYLYFINRVNVLGQCEITLQNLTSITPLEIWVPLHSDIKQQQSNNNNKNSIQNHGGVNENIKLNSMMLYARVEYKENNH